MSVTFFMDGKQISVEEGKTLLEAARENRVDIPTICFHEATTSNALCRICVVEVEGQRLLQPACIVKAATTLKVQTRSERVVRARKTILEMLASTMDLSDAPEILSMMDEYGADARRFPDAERRESEVKDDNPMYVRDYSKCLLCWRCVQVCADDAQYTYAINFEGRGFETSIGTFFNKPMPETTCVFCGQCVGVCPTGALKPKREWNILSEIVGSVLARMKHLAGEHQLEVDVPESLPLVPVDYVQMEQVFTNLVSNSVKYAPEKTVIRLRAFVEGESLHVLVSNQGPQVPQEHLERIFDKFFRITAADRVTGTGLGLSICKGIIEAHGGRIWAENVQDGLAFNFTLPLTWDGAPPPKLPMDSETE